MSATVNPPPLDVTIRLRLLSGYYDEYGVYVDIVLEAADEICRLRQKIQDFEIENLKKSLDASVVPEYKSP